MTKVKLVDVFMRGLKASEIRIYRRAKARGWTHKKIWRAGLEMIGKKTWKQFNEGMENEI